MRLSCGAFLLALLPLTKGQDLKEREIVDLVGQFTSDLTDAKGKDEAFIKLRRANPSVVKKLIVPLLSNEDKRGAALDLAIKLRLTGLFNETKKLIDGESGAKVIELFFTTYDTAAQNFLFERWKTVDVTSESFKLLDEGFRKYPVVDVSLLTKFHPYLSGANQNLKDSATGVLAAQLGAVGSDSDELLANWNKLKATFAKESMSFPPTTIDPSLVSRYLVTEVRSVGKNHRIGMTGSLAMMFDEPIKDSFVIRMKIMPKGNAGKVIFKMRDFPRDPTAEYGFWELAWGDGNWCVRSSRNEYSLPVKVGEWEEIEFDVRQETTAEGGGVQKVSRYLRIQVGGKTLLPKGTMSRPPASLEIQAEGSEIVVGGIEVKR